MSRNSNNASFILSILTVVASILTGCGGGGGGSSTLGPVTISGTAYQADGTTPLANAQVVFDGSGPSTTTNASGQYTLTVPEPVTTGSHTLVIEETSGGVTAPVMTQTIQVTSSTETGVNVTVPSTAPPPPPASIPPSIRRA